MMSDYENIHGKLEFLKEQMRKRLLPSEYNINVFNETMNAFCFQFRTRWASSSRMKERFVLNNKSWLDSSIGFPRQSSVKRGRKELQFEDCGERSKNKRTMALRKAIPSSLLAHATQMSLRADGKLKASKIVKEITTTSPSDVDKIYKSFSNPSTVTQMSREEALAVLVEAKLSRHQYNIISASAHEKFPSYSQLQLAKKDCYPKNECLTICETSAKITLQALLDHTVERILSLTNSLIDALKDDEGIIFYMGFKNI